MAARESYGRLLTYIAARTRDIAAAEDALADAFVAALEIWPREGVPKHPEAWLLTVARRRLVDGIRRSVVREESAEHVFDLHARMAEAPTMAIDFPDERLRLMFVCAHPAIDEAARTALMLQTVLGLDAARIASAFLVAPATMSQRLVRAKTRIRDARIPFEVPDAEELAGRTEAVLECIYAAYGSGWEDVSGGDPRRKDLAREAIFLGRMLVDLLPDDPEARGLLALMLYCESRKPTRRNAAGAYVPLSDQRARDWLWDDIDEAEDILESASAMNRPGRFQLEAAIQSVHVRRGIDGSVEWEAIALLYEGLVRISPTTGALIGRAAALAEARGAEIGLAALEEVPADVANCHQPYWALKAHLLSRLDRRDDARTAFQRAIGLSEDPAVREFLQLRLLGC